MWSWGDYLQGEKELAERCQLWEGGGVVEMEMSDSDFELLLFDFFVSDSSAR